MRTAACAPGCACLKPLPAVAVPPELGYGKLQVQEIPPVRALLRRGARCLGLRGRRRQNATLYFDLELLSIKKDNPFGKGKASE